MIPPLDPGVLGPLREAEPAPAAVRARARQRLLSVVGGGGPGGGGSGGPGGSRVLRIPRGIAFVLGGVVGAGLYAALAPTSAPRIVYVDRAVPSVEAATVATAAVAQATNAPPAASDVPPVTVATAATSTRGSQLSAERILLDEARAALAQGDPGRAIDRLERHRRTFQAPLLAEERDAMWVQALVKAGRYDEARARAASFRKRSPDSLFSSVVDSAIDSIP
jgi:hypothetical protein